jgi:hypothetical protein
MKPAEADGKLSPERNQQTPPASTGFMLGSIFDHEDGGDTFLRKAWLSPNYKVLQFPKMHSSCSEL